MYLAHVFELNRWVEMTAVRPDELPYSDSLDGGVRAVVLILLKTPARHSMRPRFVSRDNPGPAQRNLKRFLQFAGLELQDTVI